MCTHTLSCYNLDSIFDIRWICIGCVSITVVVAIFEMGTIFMTRPPPSLISALFCIVCLCAFCFSIPLVVPIFVRRTIFMNCPPAFHSMWCFFCCVRAFFWIDYRIIEFIGHLSFCKKKEFNDGDFFLLWRYKKKEIYILQKKKKKKKKRW